MMGERAERWDGILLSDEEVIERSRRDPITQARIAEALEEIRTRKTKEGGVTEEALPELLRDCGV
jgi:hypothetical protein